MEEVDNYCYYFSLISGEKYKIFESERKNLDMYQIPLLSNPSQSCRKCFGRGYTGKNVKLGIYAMCPCLKKVIDFKQLRSDEITVHTPKMTGEIEHIPNQEITQ